MFGRTCYSHANNISHFPFYSLVQISSVGKARLPSQQLGCTSSRRDQERLCKKRHGCAGRSLCVGNSNRCHRLPWLSVWPREALPKVGTAHTLCVTLRAGTLPRPKLYVPGNRLVDVAVVDIQHEGYV